MISDSVPEKHPDPSIKAPWERGCGKSSTSIDITSVDLATHERLRVLRYETGNVAGI